MIWAQILDTDVNYLPKLETFRYKLKKNNKDYRVEDGEVIRTYKKTLSIDGSIFLVKTKNNQFEYDDPESYLKIYPNVDELLSLQELLNLIRTEFSVFKQD